MTSRERVARESANPLEGRMTELRRMMPEVFTEGKIDFSKLHKALGDFITEEQERFNTVWVGKRSAIQTLQTPSRATLIPARDESVDFDSTQNVFIEGDNLEVLKLLYKSYFGRVKLIYIDPPYNTGKEFIYPDDFGEGIETYLRLTGQADAAGNWLTSNPETGGRYHSKWLSMMYPRLFLACQLLREDGVIMVSIDDHEVHNLRMLLNEVFGEENFIAAVIWQKVFSPKNTAKHFSEDHDYIVVYARNAEIWRPRLLPRTEEADARYENPDDDPRGPWSSSDLTARNYYSEGQYEVTGPSGKKFRPSVGTYWRVKYEKFLELDRDHRILWGPKGDNMPRLKRFLSEVKQGIVPQTLWPHTEVGNTQEAKKELLEFVKFENTDNVLDTVKPTRLIGRMLQIATNPQGGDIVMDFFAGSAATAHAVLKQNREDGGNRRVISVQLPEPLPVPEKRLKTVADIGKERIRNVIEKLKREGPAEPAPEKPDHAPDLGYRLFKLAKSNYRPWRGDGGGDAEALVKQLELQVDPLIEGWKAENVIYEVLLKEGLSLTAKIERDPRVKSNAVYKASDADGRSLYICLDDAIKRETGRLLGLKKDDLFVCRDSALTDESAANLALQCRLKTI